jgi:hypothetical protein
MPDTISGYLRRQAPTFDEARRQDLRGLIGKVDALRLDLQPVTSHDAFESDRLALDDLTTNIRSEIDRLTDEIGDEAGDDYAVERQMGRFRGLGL